MFNVEWHPETGGVRLSTLRTKETLGISPRPVFYEELDLLKLNEEGWEYPHCKEPLLWACNKQYFYRGKLVFEAKGANIYDPAKIYFQDGCEKLKLEPVDVKGMLKECEDEMFLAESEALEFIRNTYIQYASARESVERVKANQLDYEAMVAKLEKETKKKMAIVKQDCDSFDIMEEENAKQSGKKTYVTTKIDKFLASFSGGKDSQVVLDLCTRAIPPSEFEVIYSDTGYELPTSLALWEEVQVYYKAKFPELRFRTARNHESVLNYWDKIGTPSDTHRWCCSVMKTAPLYRMLKIEGTNKQAKVLTFDGVRAEESTRRSEYQRIGKGVKHGTVINSRPIIAWNSVEVFLYLFKYGIPINLAYRHGMTRVGCLICPFGAEWNEMIVNKIYPDNIAPFVSRIEQFAQSSGVKDITNYIKEGGWKRRSSGDNIKTVSYVDFRSLTPIFHAQIGNPCLDLTTFFNAVGEYYITNKASGHREGELRFNHNSYPFDIQTKHQIIEFRISNVSDPVLIGLLKRSLFKATYCIKCLACEIECPTGALSIYPKTTINEKVCIHCHRCLEHYEKGCIVANSLHKTTGNMNTKNIDRYKNFGLKTEWVDMYLSDRDDFWTSNNGLNPNYQIPALKSWLKDAEIIDDKNNITPLGELLSTIRENNPTLVWEIIWINLSYNSFIVNWYAKSIKKGMQFSSKLLEELLINQFPAYKSKTVHNAVYQLLRTLKESPIGDEMCQGEMISKDAMIRNEYEDLSYEAIAYSIYKYAKIKEISSLRVADLYNGEVGNGIALEFCVSKAVLEKGLRYLNSSANRVLVAELNMGLDSITLREDLDAYRALSLLVQ